MTHTPGSWHRKGSVIFAGKYPIARTLIGNTKYQLTLKQERENARLIAAAPQLYEALEELCKETRKAHADRNNLTPGCAVCDAIKAGEQALAAVEGGE